MDKIQKRIEFLKKRYPNYNEMLEFYEIVLITREKFSQKPKVESLKLNKADIEKIKKGNYLLSFKDIDLDLEMSFNLFCEFCDELKKIKQFKGKIKKFDFIYTDFTMFINMLNELNNPNSNLDETDNNFLKFMILNSLRPSLKKLVENVSISYDIWKQGTCPICGNEPFFGIIKEDSKKIVECEFCGFNWRIERIFCPFCKTKNQEKLKYFEDENEPQYRVYLCDNCKRYIKFVKEKEAEYLSDLMIEDAVTVHYDVIAKEKGYSFKI